MPQLRRWVQYPQPVSQNVITSSTLVYNLSLLVLAADPLGALAADERKLQLQQQQQLPSSMFVLYLRSLRHHSDMTCCASLFLQLL